MIWSFEDGNCVAVLAHSPGFEPTSQELFFKTKRAIPSQPVNALALLSGNRLASGSSDSTIKIWKNLDDSKCLALLKGHKAAILALQVFSETILASASVDNTVLIWNLANNQCLQRLTDHANLVVTLKTISGSELVIRSLDSTIKIWYWGDAFGYNRTLANNFIIQRSVQGFPKNSLEFFKIA